MNTSLVIEPTSTGQLLSSMGLAIDEAKLVRSLIQSGNLLNKLKLDDPYSPRLIFLTRDISHIEAKLTQVRKAAASI